MSKIEIRKAEAQDEDSIVHLLNEFYPGIPDHWRKLFNPRNWSIENDFPGFIIEDNEKIVGFLGTIFSEQETSLGKTKFCNLTSWFVQEKYRRYTIALFSKVLKLPDMTITNFTPAPHLYDLLTKIGFQHCQAHQTLILPIPQWIKKDKIQLKIDNIEDMLQIDLLDIYRQHKNLNVKHILITNGDKQCYCIAVLTRYKKVPLAKIYYVSDSELFSKVIATIRFRLCVKLKVCYLLTEGNITKKVNSFGFFKKTLTPPRLYKSNNLSKHDINLLFSELFILGV